MPPYGEAEVEWLTLADGAVVAQGRGVDWPRAGEAPTRALLIAPATAVTVHRALLPDLAPRQAQAAARLMALETTLGAPDTLHVATGARDGDGALDVAVVASADLAGWLGWASAQGLDPRPVVPAALLLPRPDDGFVRAQVGAETIARDRTSAFALDPDVAALVIGDAAVAEVSADAVIAALADALDAPPLDLRQGAFAVRQRRGVDWALIRRSAVLIAAIMALSLSIALVTIARLDRDTDRLDTAALARARTVVPDVGSVGQAEAALDARAAALGVGGRGFAGGAARLFAALDQSPAATLTTFELAADGTIRATLTAPNANDLNIAVAALRSSGAGAVSTPSAAPGGGQAVQLTVTPQDDRP